MSHKQFLKDLLRINSDVMTGNPEDKQKFSDFQKGIMDGFLSQFKEDDQKAMKAMWNEKSLIEILDGIDESMEGDVVSMIDQILEKFSDHTPLQHQNITIDPIDLFNRYHTLKVKHQKFQESEDINNF